MAVFIGLVYLTVSNPSGADFPEFSPDRSAPMEIVVKSLPWFRCYTEIIDDEKLCLLAFEDRWHYVALLACKAKGLIDQSDEFMREKIRRKFGLTLDEFDKCIARLAKVKLIDPTTLEPNGWASRQFESDSSKGRVKAFREKQKASKGYSNDDVTPIDRYSNGNVTFQDTDTDTDKETDTEEKHISIKPKKNHAISKPDGVNETIWRDFLTHRKSLNAPVSSTVLAGFEREAKKAGVSLEDAIRISIERGWRGFRASWELEKPSVPAKPKMDEKTKHYLRLTGRAHLIDKEVVDV